MQFLLLTANLLFEIFVTRMLAREELLYKERLSLLLHNIRNRNRTFQRDDCPIPIKDAKVSTSLRKQGNALYIQYQNNISNNPNRGYVEAWNKYTESILYAPNNSEELALGYGNRSAMMLYLRSFEECIIECDRALSITSSDLLRFKLLCRKAESLCQLNRCDKEVRKEALKLLDSLDLGAAQKKYYKEGFEVLMITKFMKSAVSETYEKKNYARALMDFERSPEVPCASKSVAIQYNEEWGRHIVATEDIPAGKIIANEDFFSTRYDYINYICCNNCQKQIHLDNSLPCEHCVYNLYCSESCREEAWKKYHQFQCCITPFLNFIECIEGTSERSLKFVLLAIHQVGGIEQMKQQLLEIENVDDPRMKGFSGGIFQHDKLINFFCLEGCKEENLNDKTRFAYLENSCLCAYLLAKHTNFLGEKMNLLEAEMFLNEDILFTAALFLRFYYINHRNMNVVTTSLDGNSPIVIEIFAPFGSLFNHSCDPNVKSISDSRATYIIRYPIKKGSQLFVSYDNNIFNHRDKESRQKYLQEKHNFTCNCLACTENWSSVCLPSLKYVLEVVPSLKTSLPVDTIKLLKSIHKYTCFTEFKPKLAKKILYHLNLLSTCFTVYCEQYFVLLRSLDVQYIIALRDNKAYQASVCVFDSIFKL